MTQTNMLLQTRMDSTAGRSLGSSVRILMIAAAAIAVLHYDDAAFAGEFVKPGDRAEVRFTCRLKNGEVAMSTYEEVASDPSFSKSTIYIPRDRSNPLTLTAGKIPGDLPASAEKGFEGEVVSQLSKAIIGLPFGAQHTVEIKADRLPERQEGQYLIKIARVRQRPKEMRFTPSEYQAQTGNAPVVGRTFVIDPVLPGRVESVSETEVLVRFPAEPGQEVETPFGKGIVRVLSDKYEIVIDASPGRLVRTEDLIGRIIDVDEESITLDYSHPFGGESLFCDVSIESPGTGRSEKDPSQIPTAQEGLPPATGVGGKEAEIGEESEVASAKVKDGDLVQVNYTATLEDGRLVYSNRPGVAQDSGIRKAAGYKEPKVFVPEEVIAGKPAKVPGVGESVIGMVSGERKKMTIGPESAYGLSDPRKVQTFPSVQTFPKIIHISPADFIQQFKIFPVQGKEVPFSPYFKARVMEVTETSAVLELLFKEGEQFDGDFGSVVVLTNGDGVVVSLSPRIGAAFKTEAGEGIITGTDGKTFTVDLNSPLAGKAIVLDIELVSWTPKSALESIKIPWMEKHDEGLAEAKRDGKPAVMVLYADWCGWCKRLFNESFQDPRIRILQDRLVWIKVNSDQKAEYKERYKQGGFPLILLMEPDGRVARRIDGFADAAALRGALGALIDGPSKGRI